ncbi:MAG: hypothetical protein Q9181_004154 [Wetmoreana brouardii]
MAEAASLVIGIAGLAGVCNACLEAFSLISAGRSLGRDFEILATKLDIEKTLLLHWAERVGLLTIQDEHPIYDARFSDAQTHTAVINTLSCVLYLLTDSERLQSQYGLLQSSPDVIAPEVSGLLSSFRMGAFTRSYQRLQIRIGRRQNDTALLSRTKWAIRDRDKFGSLINELGRFISYLNELLPDQAYNQQRQIHEDIERVANNIGSLRLIQEASGNHRNWSEVASAYAETCSMDSVKLQHVENWREKVSAEKLEDMRLSEYKDTVEGRDPEAFHKVATGHSETLAQLCQSNHYAVFRTDSDGHTLLRYALKDNHMENARILLRHGSAPDSHEPLYCGDSNSTPYVSHINFLIFQCEKFFPPRANEDVSTFSKMVQLLTLLLDNGADTFRPCIGANLDEDIPFITIVCGGPLQALVPLYLSKRPVRDFERFDMKTGYTPLLAVCNSTFDPYGHKLEAIQSFVDKGVDTRICCKNLKNSPLHLALLSARDEVNHVDGKLWKGDSEQLQSVLVTLLRGNAEINLCNYIGLTPSDLALGLNCVESWNKALQGCGFHEHMVDETAVLDPFGQDLLKQGSFDKLWEDYHHFTWFGKRCHVETSRPESGHLSAYAIQKRQARWMTGSRCCWYHFGRFREIVGFVKQLFKIYEAYGGLLRDAR